MFNSGHATGLIAAHKFTRALTGSGGAKVWILRSKFKSEAAQDWSLVEVLNPSSEVIDLTREGAAATVSAREPPRFVRRV